MRLLLVPLFSLVVVVAAAAQTPDGPQGNRFIVQVGVFSVRPDGTVGGYAVQTGEADNKPFAGGVATDGCQVGAGQSWLSTGMPTWARDGWEIRGRVDKLSADQATIQLDWRRVRAAAAAVEQPVESRTLTLPLDQLVTLDAANENNPLCDPKSMVFGARYTSRVVHAGSGGAAAHGVGAAGRNSSARTGAGVAAGAVYSAELWLVHGAPGKPENVVSTTVRVTTGPAAFGFAPMRVSVPGGTLVVHVNGQLHVLRGTGSQPALMFEAKRDASFTPSNKPPRDAAEPDPEGRASVTRQLPGPDDVLEFEMPPLALRGLPVPSDTFAVRLRLKPVKDPF